MAASGPQETAVFRPDVYSLSAFPSESPGPNPGLGRPEPSGADSQVHEQWNEPVSVTIQDGQTPSQLLDPREVDGQRVARRWLEQLGALALRLDAEYERLTKVTNEADARSAATLDTVRNIEGRVAALAAELNRCEAQAPAQIGVVRVSSETAQTLVIDRQVPPLPVTNATVTPQLRQRWVTLILHRRNAAAGLVTLAVIGLLIATSLRRIDHIGAAPFAAPPPVASVPIPSRTTDITLPLEAQKAPEPAPRRPSSRRPSVNQPRAAAFVGSLALYSDPPGATVLVNGRSAGVTPLQVARLPAGNYVVWLERDGYERWTNGVLVPANKLTRVSAKLEALRTARSPQN